MHARATIIMDERYYRESCAEWLGNVSKWRRWQALVGVVLIAVAVVYGVMARAPMHRGLSALLLFAGAVEIVEYHLCHRKWMRERRADPRWGATSTLEFLEDRLVHAGPFSRGELLYAGLHSVTPTPWGMFLRPQKGMSVYLPDRAWEREGDKRRVLDLIGRCQVNAAGGA